MGIKLFQNKKIKIHISLSIPVLTQLSLFPAVNHKLVNSSITNYIYTYKIIR